MATWDAEVGAANWEPPNAVAEEPAAGSDFPETKDDRAGMIKGEEETAGLGNDWQDSRAAGVLPESEQAMTQDPVSEPSAVVITGTAGGSCKEGAGGGGGGGAGGSGRGTAAPPSATSGVNGVRRHAMAFEIARVERFGETFPPASLEKAKRVWDLSRPRYVETVESEMGGSRRVRVPPGKECEVAVPYGVWSTSSAQMGDFGLDIGMYFVTIAQLIGAVLVYAALCVVAIMHFSSDNYSGGQLEVRIDLRGSAVCTSSSKVFVSPSREAMFRNDCPLDDTQGYADMAGVLLLFLVLLVLGKAQEKAAEYTETQVRSARPYTVKVSSPDHLADDPDRWRRLFAQFGHVSYVTVARGNGALLRAMTERRRVGRMLEGSTANVSEIIEAYKAVEEEKRPKLGPGGWCKTFLHPFGLFRNTKYWKQQLWLAHKRVECEVVKGMQDQGLPVVKVFVTFESDMSQARCLSHMSHGLLDAPEEQHMYTNPNGFKEALNVMPSSSASEVLYENLHVTRLERAFAQALSFALVAAMVLISFLVCYTANESSGPVAVAFIITFLDALFPCLVREACSLERHHNSVSHDLSFMNKLTLARWANLAGIPFVLNDHEGTLTESNLELVATVLLLNVFVLPLIRLLDLPGRWERDVVAPKEVVQAAMDSRFRGSNFSLSERYTDTTKTLFACLLYTPVLPSAMWLCFFALTFSYWTDKYLFMKAWRTPQPTGNSGTVGKLARRHLALAVLAHCLVSLYYYAGWPFDKICRYQDGWIMCSQEGTGVVESETQQWMTGSQKTLVNVFSSLNVAWLVILLIFYYLQSVLHGISMVVKGAPRKLRSRQHMPFSQLTSRYQHEVDAYVPQVVPPDQPLPLLACDLDLIEPETIPWNVDGQKGDSFENYCLSSSRDLPRISRYQRSRLFSRCLHYPPPAPFEEISHGRASKTDIDWFRRPPPAAQETKMPFVNEMDQIPEEVARSAPMGNLPGLVDPELVERHPQSQAPLQSNGEISVVASSRVSREGEREPMMPGGGQSSLVSTAILRVGSVEAGEGSTGTAMLKDIGAANGVATAGSVPGGGDNGGAGMQGVAMMEGREGVQGVGEAMLVREEEQGTEVADGSRQASSSHNTGQSFSRNSGRLYRSRSPRIRHGEETCNGDPVSRGSGNAVEPAAGPRSAPRENSSTSTSTAGGVNVDSGVNPSVSGAAVATSTEEGVAAVVNVAADACGNGGVGTADALVAQGDGGNGGVLMSRGGSGDVDAKGREDLLPTPVLAPRAVGHASGLGASGVSGAQWREGVSRGDGGAFVSQEGGHGLDREEGWVDQYTSSSLGASQVASPSVSSSVAAEEEKQWRKDDLAPAV